jgi:hypothetical protein
VPLNLLPCTVYATSSISSSVKEELSGPAFTTVASVSALQPMPPCRDRNPCGAQDRLSSPQNVQLAGQFGHWQTRAQAAEQQLKLLEAPSMSIPTVPAGEARPWWAHWRRWGGRMAGRVCRICGRSFPPGYGFSHGRCQMCAAYWRQHGVERPPGPPRAAATLRPCTHCGQLTWGPIRGRCALCYPYWYAHGVDRPLEPPPARVAASCQTCGQLVWARRRGRCDACYMYWYRSGRERPPERWRRG